jgi:DNA adenine methylase
MASGALNREMLDAWRARVRVGRPFLKWAGGKQHFLFNFADRMPDVQGTYIEPFLGSGAVFFKLMSRQAHPGNARLGDVNKQLVNCFIGVRDNPEGVSDRLDLLQQGYLAAKDRSEFYYKQREIYNATLPKPDAAVFIFINRTCWNGLYRVNQAGRFNVPFGAPKSEIVIPTRDDLLNASAALAQSHIRATTWQNTLAFAQPGDFVFMDPPYYSELVTDDHRATKYQRRQFTLRDHHELSEALVQLERRSIDFILTNSAESEMVDLYRSHALRVEVIQAPRSINSKVDRRGPVDELLVSSANLKYEKPDQLAWMLIEKQP